MIKVLQGSVVTETVFGGLAIYLLVVNFLWYICAKYYENWLAIDKIIAIIKGCPFYGPQCIMFITDVTVMSL